VIRVVFADGERRERDLLRRAAVDASNVSLVGVARDGQELVQMAVQYRPDVAVLPEELKVIDGYEAASLITAAAPGVKPVLLVREETPEVLRRAMRAGVRRILARPVEPSLIMETAVQVAEADQIQNQAEYQTALDPTQFPRMLAVTGAKGGVGKTSLSTNLAVALAKADRGATCIVDLYTQFGDVAAHLDVRPRQTLVDLVKLGDEIDSDVVAAATLKHPSGLDILLGSSTPHALDALPVERLDQVLSALRRRYRFIVVDVPPILHAGTLHVLETAHLMLLVCNLLDLTTVTDTRRLLDSIMDVYVPKERVRLILNRVARQNQLQPEQVEQTLGIPPWLLVPNDDALVTACANRGQSFVIEAPNNPVSMAVKRAAEVLIEDPDAARPATPLESRKPERRGLFGFMGRDAAPETAPLPKRGVSTS
jgi:pilus assembly protein CpaE